MFDGRHYNLCKMGFCDENYQEMSVKSNDENGYTYAAGVCLFFPRSMKKLF